MGNIVTFYSYKGGVGRSMALANIAVLSALDGLRTMVIDWDLEAPGLENYFLQYFPTTSTGPGLLPFLDDIAAGENPSYREYTTEIEVASGRSLTFLSSGQEDDREGYAGRLERLDWTSFFAAGGGDRIEDLRQRLKADFDLVLIDSRTGLSDSGGICTIQVPDVVVAMFTANNQSMVGARDAMRLARQARQGLATQRMQLVVLPLPARFGANAELNESNRWIGRIGETFAEFFEDWLPTSINPADVLDRIKLPQVDFFGFGEKLAVVEHGVNSPQSLGFCYNQIAQILRRDFQNVHEVLGLRPSWEQPDALLDPNPSGHRAVYQARTADLPDDGYRYDLYVSHAEGPQRLPVDNFLDILTQRLAAELGREPRIFIDSREIQLGEHWVAKVQSALRRSRLLLSLLTPRYFTSSFAQAEFETFREREALTGATLIVPVALRGRGGYPSSITDRMIFDLSDSWHGTSRTDAELERGLTNVAGRIVDLLSAVPPFRATFPVVDPVQAKPTPTGDQPRL